jgi:hypothetical protein
MTHRAEISFIRGKHQKSIMDRDNVVGMGVGYKLHGGKQTDEMCVVVLVTKKLPRQALHPSAIIPHSLDGVSTDIIEVGDIKALQSRTDRWRPVPGGVSIGHYLITAGTFGVMVRDRATNERMILSNNHVLANSNQAEKGDAILQPGVADGGRVEDDVVAVLERFQPIQFNVAPPSCSIANAVVVLANLFAKLLGSKHRLLAIQQNPQAVNQVDAAVAKPAAGIEISDEILDIGVIGGATPANLGMQVRKSGRSTGFTSGQITVLDATVDVSYGSSVARFENQILSSPMSAPGDSGSLLVAEGSLLAVGLLFAGSEKVTIYNPIDVVLDSLGVYL